MKILSKLALTVVAVAVLAFGPIGLAHAQVKVTSADPASTTQGTVSLDVIINGSGFDNGSTARFLVTGTTNDGGVSVQKVVFKNSRQLVATIDVADAAATTKFDIEVTTTTGRKGKGTTLFSVLRKAVVAPDPCVSGSPDYVANWAGFPAYAFVVYDSGTGTSQLRVASRNGVCSKLVGGVQSGRIGSTSFASSAPGQYVIAWDAARLMITRFSVPSEGENDTTIPAIFTVFRSDSGAVPADLSPDATSLVYRYGSADLYPSVQIRVASLSDATGSTDRVIQTLNGGDSIQVWWAPWDKIYYNELDATKTRKLLAIDPYGSVAQTPRVLLQFSATAPLVVNQLFQFGRISGGYAGYDAFGAIPYLVFQGYYATSVKKSGQSGSSCVAAYALNTNTNAFMLGSLSTPSPIVGFNPSVTIDATVLYEKADTPPSGASCWYSGYLGESKLVMGAMPQVIDSVPGSWPAALKTR